MDFYAAALLLGMATAVQISILKSADAAVPEFLGILAIALYPCDAHDASGLLYLRPRAGTPIVVAWQAMNGAVVMRSVYAPQE